MSIQPGQKILTTGLPSLAAAKPGLMNVDTGGPDFVGMIVGGGTVILNGATPVVVPDKRVGAGSIIVFTLKTVGGTVSATAPNILTITPGTGFTVAGVALDTSTYNYAIFG